ncbi:uncharacterized protein LOC117175233 isoform X2 [Belonocnema kinseyi]|uniref:uncharacterized protein LOC117175233 isoform X2 n=1 Tax=Belonocnema kinseyi TaxID=2817044 RepID=UPI00143CFAD2|nr:uncharacterized protein LOC117175233 isoform X2 [Belonocnema kinseyi]
MWLPASHLMPVRGRLFKWCCRDVLCLLRCSIRCCHSLMVAELTPGFELSLQLNSSPNRGSKTHHNPSIRRSGTSSSSSSSERSPPSLELSLRVGSKSPPTIPPSSVEPCLRIRSRSPSARHEYSLGLEHIRLIPHSNPHQRFEIRKYTFPPDKPIQLRGKINNTFKPMTTNEQHVLTTSTGDVVAILVGTTHLRGIYSKGDLIEQRVKINMYSGLVEDMTSAEIQDSPIGQRFPILNNFRIVNVKDICPHS